MAGIYNGPARGGTRGGKDQFNWESVRADQDREYYLGHSVKALTGRWQKGKDVYWYTREKEGDAQAAREKELAMVKQREEDLMMEALGMKPRPPKPVTQPKLDGADMQKILHGAGDAAEEEDPGAEDRVKGLGFNASRLTGAVQDGEMVERLAGVGTSQSVAGTRQQPASTRGGPGVAQAEESAPPRADIRKQDRREEKKVQS
ncbi:hypothetical protein ACKKBG_A28065 [Auxenochlorella protothecoides x Auxenochlorella symbiontica]|nr:Multiple myeloma tumor-associated protein 2-like protein [Auxenochlorella protothecoides]KFM24805.1 Multiple myeloma tumor-associated protein 2-like protein [Auxenochlorella protothecoides]